MLTAALSAPRRLVRAIKLSIAALVVGTAAAHAPASSPAIGVDHILIGAANLELAVSAFERQTGVQPALGGSHPGLGTRNAVVSLGHGSFPEIIAPDPAQKPTGFAKFLATLPAMTPIKFALHTGDLDALHAAFVAGSVQAGPIMSGSRIRPNGQRLTWRTFEVGPENDVSPFFIQWDDPKQHPSIDAPQGCRVDQIAVGTGLTPNVLRALALIHRSALVKTDLPSGLHLALRCRGRSIRF